MKKFVEVTGAIKRGSGLSSLMTHSPSCSSCWERNAIDELSGDQRGVDAENPAGNNVRGDKRRSGKAKANSGRGEGLGCAVGSTGMISGSKRAIHKVLTVLLSATEETV